MNKFLKHLFLITGGIVAFLLILILLAVLLIQTGPVRKKMAGLAEQQASGYINGKLSIGGIEGNFYNHLRLNNLSLTTGKDTVISVRCVDVRFDLWTMINGQLRIHSSQIDHPRVFLKQINDSIWNIQQLMKPLPENKTDPDPAGDFTIDLASFGLSEGTIVIESPDTLIPHSINHINTKLSLRWNKLKQQVLLNSFSLSTVHPDLKLEQLAFQFDRDTSRMELTGLSIKTAMNRLEGEAALGLQKTEPSAASIQSDSLKTREFQFFLPGLILPATPVLKLDASVHHDSLRAVLYLFDKGQDIRLELASPNFTSLLYHQKDTVVRYQLQAYLKHIDLAHWLGRPDLKYLINGQLHIKGSGTDWKTATAGLNGRFTESRIADYPVDKLDLDFALAEGDLEGYAEGQGNFGAFRIAPQIRDLSSTPSYQAELTTRQLNLARLTGIDSLQSSVNLRARINGKGFDPKSLFIKAAVNIARSQIRQVRVDTMFANIRYEREDIRLDSVWLKTGDLSLGASGNYSLQNNSDISLTARFNSIGEFAPFMPVDSLQSSGIVKGHLTGKKDSLHLRASIFLNESRYQDFSFQGLKLDGNAILTKADTLIQADLLVETAGNKTIMIDSLSARIEARPDSVYLDAKIAGKDLTSHMKTGILPGEKIKLILTDWLIDYKNEHWALQESPATIEIDPIHYRISDFRLASGKADSSQYVVAEGLISREGDEDFQLKLANISLAGLAGLFHGNTKASGLLNLNMDLKGTAALPFLKGDFNLQHAVFNQYPLRKMEGKFSYQDHRAKLDAQIVPRDSGRIDFTGEVPLFMRLDSMLFNFNPQDRINAQLLVERFPLGILNAFITSGEAEGFMNGEVTVNGTIDSPNPKGNLGMKNGAFRMNEYGIDYRDIAFNIRFLPEKIDLDTFRIRTSDGQMTATGQLDFNSAFYRGDLNKSKINIKFNKFNPVDHDQFNMQLSGDASLSGEKGKVVFGGNLNIPQSEIFLPAVLALFGKMNTYEIPEPILIKEMKKMSGQADTVILANKQEAEEGSADNNGYLDDVTGKIKLKIPRNTWIKSDDMHIELSGDLEIIKNKDFPELFGTVDVVRGQYDLLGKTFVIDEGTIRFQGGEKITPHLDITASYGFRSSEQVEQNLSVHVTGTAESPAVSFSMAGDSINEGDAFSYILFGKGMSELTADQQTNMAGSGGGTIAGNAAASLISSQISNFLGDKLDMDYLEIKSEGGFENATVVVGKYITNNLFVSYEQRLGEKNQKDDLATYEVKLEYELFKFLFLQLNNSSVDSGFDVIFKLNSK